MGAVVEFETDKRGRVKYHPAIHFNHGQPLTEEDKEYLCAFYKQDGRKSMVHALGRTEATIAEIYKKLKQQGLVEYYRQRYLARFE